MSLRDKVFTPKVERVKIEGEEVEIRTLNAKARAALEDGLVLDKDRKPDPLDLIVRTVVFTTFNLDGTPVFKPDDVERLKTEANGNDLFELFQTASRLNAMTKETEAKN